MNKGVNEMAPVVISIAFWLVGIVLLISQRLVINRLKAAMKKMDEKSEQTKFNDNSASIAYSMGENALDVIPWDYIRLICVIIGMIIIALGFVPLGFLDI